LVTGHHVKKAGYKVLLTTSGVGGRLGAITEYTNKSLVVLGNKPAISHIIENYPPETTFVVTLGYFGNHVREFLKLSHPDSKFEFVEVQNYNGPGGSLALSILQAKDYLQEPFIFHACDTLLINEEIPSPTFNWVGGFKGSDATNYASFDVSEKTVQRFHDKGMIDFDSIHIGIVGINNYLEFWQELDEIITKDPLNIFLNDVSVLKKLTTKGVLFSNYNFVSWIDIGNSSSLASARKKFNMNSNILTKVTESISFVNNSVVKFFADSDIVARRVKRAVYLQNIIPTIEASSANFYKYKFEPGVVISKSYDPRVITNLLNWAKVNLWVKNDNSNNEIFKNNCRKFYIEKSFRRVNEFLETRGINDKPSIINSIEVPTTTEMIKAAEKIIMSDLIETTFHGDFILDNILQQNKGFKLVDWRDSFGDSIQFGDMYYDIAKLNHSLHVNHEIINQILFFVEEMKAFCDVLSNTPRPLSFASTV
jgi:NDP-sugar pyrophosphorylase family protein